MNNELRGLIKKFEDCSDLFDEADQRILYTYAAEQMQERKKQEELKREAIKKAMQLQINTENLASSILSLISDTLASADHKKGSIDSVEKYGNLGTITSRRVNGTELSFYSIDDEGITISLNYSREGYDTSNWGGSFINEDNIDWTYLMSILNPVGVKLSRKTGTYNTSGSQVDMHILTITLKRTKDISAPRLK